MKMTSKNKFFSQTYEGKPVTFHIDGHNIGWRFQDRYGKWVEAWVHVAGNEDIDAQAVCAGILLADQASREIERHRITS